jgi:hypothetical protein
MGKGSMIVAVRRKSVDIPRPADPIGPASVMTTPSLADAVRVALPKLFDLDRQLVDLGRRMPSPFVHPQHGVLGRTRRQAEDTPGLRIQPGTLEMNPLVSLNSEILLMRRPKLLLGHTEESTMDVHKLWHLSTPNLGAERNNTSMTATADPSLMCR